MDVSRTKQDVNIQLFVVMVLQRIIGVLFLLCLLSFFCRLTFHSHLIEKGALREA